MPSSLEFVVQPTQPAEGVLDVPAIAEELEGASAGDILEWAANTFAPRVTFGTGFGVEGCVLIHLIAERKLPIDLFTLDTGLLFRETYALWKTLEAKYGVRIRAVRPAQSVEVQALHWGPRLWTRDPDKCCELRKVEPLRQAVAGMDAWISAIRRDQTPERAAAPVVARDARFGVVKINPLVRWTTKDIWKFIFANDVPYNRLHDEGYPSIGCQPCTTPVGEEEDPRSGRWRGQGKRECGLHATSPATLPLISRRSA
jgi:phosphoadenosine phosphosulfate reductase